MQVQNVVDASGQALTILENDSFWNPATGAFAGITGNISGSNADLLDTQFGRLKGAAAQIAQQLQKKATGTGAQFTDADAQLAQAAAGLVGTDKSNPDARYAVANFRNRVLDVTYGPGEGPPRIIVPPASALLSPQAAEAFLSAYTPAELATMNPRDLMALKRARQSGG